MYINLIYLHIEGEVYIENGLVAKENFIAKVEELIANGDDPFSIAVADIDNLENINKVCGLFKKYSK